MPATPRALDPMVVRLRTRRARLSPFHDCYAGPETELGLYAGRLSASDNGEDVAERYRTLRRAAVLYDVPEKPVQIEGPDAVPFLERIFARRVGDLREGRGRYAVACTARGGVFMDGILFRLAEDRFWYVQADGPFEAWLLALSDGHDVAISDPDSRVLQIQGPTSMAVMNAASGGAIEGLRYFHAGFFDLGGQRLYVSRTGWTGEIGYEVYTQGSATDCPRLWHHLLQAGAPHGMVPGSAASMKIRRIEAGILDNGTDMDTTMTPFEAGLGAFVDLDKEGFIGRAALMDADRRPLLRGVVSKTATPDRGDTVLDDGRPVGRLTVGAWSPALGGIGYVRFDAPGDWTGRTLSLATRDGGSHACSIVDLPFYDPEKRIPRGLATNG